MALILYVEDHPPAQMLMRAIVDDLTAHHLEVASTGTEACTKAQTLLPALYIVDLDLPDTDGLALATELKAIHTSPVILVSAYAESVKDTAIRSIVSVYLPKPLDPTHVAETIERTLAR